MQELTLVVVRT